MAACDDLDDDGAAYTETSACSVVGTTWWNQTFAEQSERFHVEMAVTPARSNLDAVVGLASAPASGWTGLAAIVRFNLDGTIDARAGATYRADAQVAYQGGVTYYVRLDVDIRAGTYSVRVGTQPEGSTHTTIATDYPFRTEQAGVTSLEHVGAYVNVKYGGSLTVCGIAVITDPVDGSCSTSTAGAGFSNFAIYPSDRVQHVSVAARPSAENMDGVIGVANGPVDAFNDYAASLRFATNGYIEVRDGDTYRADVSVPYIAGRAYELKLVIDVPSKTYSVFVRNYPELLETTQIARGYRFRTQQANVDRLDHAAMIVDSSFGTLETCDLQTGFHKHVLAVRDGTFDVHPLADGGALIADAVHTLRVDAYDITLASVAVGGQVAADPQGNFYVASVANGALTVRAYTSAFAPRWTRSYATTDGAVGDVVVTSAGHVAVVLGDEEPSTFFRNPSNFAPARVALIDAYGSLRAMSPLFSDTTAIGMTAEHFAAARQLPDGVEVQVWRHGAPPALVRTRQFSGDLSINRVSIAGDGSVVFAGQLGGAVDFGSCAIAPYPNPEATWRAYVTALHPDLMTAFCRNLTSNVTGLSHDDTQIAVAYYTQTQLHYVDVEVYDRAGNLLKYSYEDAFVGHFGTPGQVMLAADGRLYLNVFASFDGWSEPWWPFLVTLSL